MNIVKDAFAGAAERDIYTGDQVEIVVITKDGMQTEYFPVCRRRAYAVAFVLHDASYPMSWSAAPPGLSGRPATPNAGHRT